MGSGSLRARPMSRVFLFLPFGMRLSLLHGGNLFLVGKLRTNQPLKDVVFAFPHFLFYCETSSNIPVSRQLTNTVSWTPLPAPTPPPQHLNECPHIMLLLISLSYIKPELDYFLLLEVSILGITVCTNMMFMDK